jgi:hypothetical protein
LNGDHEGRIRRDGGQVFGYAVALALFAVVLLFIALLFFGSPNDGEPEASIDLTMNEIAYPHA